MITYTDAAIDAALDIAARIEQVRSTVKRHEADEALRGQIERQRQESQILVNSMIYALGLGAHAQPAPDGSRA